MEPHDLYGLPLEQFTEQRNLLARELRRAGERDQAAAVSKLRKPSVAAWAVNQLVRTQQREVQALFSTGDALRQAQSDVLARRGDAASLRQRVEAERAAVDHLIDKARGLLNSDGHELTPARLEQVIDTLHAAALDPDAREKVKDGCLERELRHVGLGGLDAGGAPPPTRQPRRQQGRQAGRQTPKQTQPRSDGRKQAAAARQAAAAARRRVEAAARQLRKAEQRRDRTASELNDAEGAVTAARELLAAAEEEQSRTEQRLTDS